MSHKPILFISDLHLGAGAANDFVRTAELHRFLDYAGSEASELVLLGDVCELLQSELTDVYIQHHALFAHLFDLAERLPVTYVLGNHDALFGIDYDVAGRARLLGSRIRVTPTYHHERLKIHAEHGHQFDAYNHRPNPRDVTTTTLGDRIACAVGWLEEHVSSDVDVTLEHAYARYMTTLTTLEKDVARFAADVTPASGAYRGDYSEYERGALRCLTNPAIDVVVMGHTHEPLMRRFKKTADGAGGLYVNTGSWIGIDAAHPPIFVEVGALHARLVNASNFAVIAHESRLDPREVVLGQPITTPSVPVVRHG